MKAPSYAGIRKYPVPAFPGRTHMTVVEQAAENTAQQPVHTRALIIGTGFSALVWPSNCSGATSTS